MWDYPAVWLPFWRGLPGQLGSLAVPPDLHDITHTLIDLGAGFIRQQLVDDTLVQTQLAAIAGNLEHIVL